MVEGVVWVLGVAALLGAVYAIFRGIGWFMWLPFRLIQYIICRPVGLRHTHRIYRKRRMKGHGYYC